MPADGLLTAISFGGVGTPPLAASYQYTPCAVCVEGMLGSEGGPEVSEAIPRSLLEVFGSLVNSGKSPPRRASTPETLMNLCHLPGLQPWRGSQMGPTRLDG
jgi:hypothetical protein